MASVRGCLGLLIAAGVPGLVQAIPHSSLPPAAPVAARPQVQSATVEVADPRRPDVYIEITAADGPGDPEAAYRSLVRGPRRSANTVVVEGGRIFLRFDPAAATASRHHDRPVVVDVGAGGARHD